MATFDIAYTQPGTVKTEFARSLIETALAHPNTAFLPSSGKNLVRNKNVATQYWLDTRNGDWLLWLDSDLSWTQEGLAQLLETADEKGPSIISGLGFQWSGSKIYPGFFAGYDKDGTLTIGGDNERIDYPRDTAFKIPAAGGGCMLIHHEVFQAIKELPHTESYPWFFSGTDANGKVTGYAQQVSEGAKRKRYDVWCEPRFEVVHYEPIAVTSEFYDKWWGKQ